MQQTNAAAMLLSVETVRVKGKGLEGLALFIGYLVIGGAAFYVACSVAAWILWSLIGLFGGHGALAVIFGAMVSVTVWGWVSDYRRDKKKQLRANAEELTQ